MHREVEAMDHKIKLESSTLSSSPTGTLKEEVCLSINKLNCLFNMASVSGEVHYY